MQILTDKEKAILAKLTYALLTRKFKVSFNMNYFTWKKGRGLISPLEVKNECGTNCCFLGHAPLVFPKLLKPFESKIKPNYMRWKDLSEILFPSLNPDTTDGASWSFLFGQTWKNNKNQAAQRALIMLEDKYSPDWKYSSFKHPGKVSPSVFKKWFKVKV